MNLKISNYTNCIPTIKSTITNNFNRCLSEQLSLCAIATDVHIVVISYLYEQVYGSSEELLRLREIFINFHRCSVDLT